jgi:integrase/recombinase XerD
LNIETPKQWKVLPKSLAREEMGAVLEASKAVSNKKEAAAIALRDRAMLEVFYAGALRVSEMVGVKLEDLKLEMGYLLVRGKGDKERIVPLGKSAQGALAEYLKSARSVLANRKSSPQLFLGRGAHKLTRQRVWQMVNAAANAAGRHASPHMLRHSCGYFYDAGVHTPGAGSVEERVSEASSAGEGTIRRPPQGAQGRQR